MKFIREQWQALVALVWSVVAVVALTKGDYLFAAIAVLLSIALWASYRRERRSRAQQALGGSGT
jgi:uncharacterized membrane protein